jgi:hypothetical protein
LSALRRAHQEKVARTAGGTTGKFLLDCNHFVKGAPRQVTTLLLPTSCALKTAENWLRMPQFGSVWSMFIFERVHVLTWIKHLFGYKKLRR